VKTEQLKRYANAGLSVAQMQCLPGYKPFSMARRPGAIRSR